MTSRSVRPYCGAEAGRRAARRAFVLALCLLATRAEGQSPVRRVRIAIVEGDTAPSERTRAIAALVRARLERLVTREQLHVVPRKDLMTICDIGDVPCPNWSSPSDLREVGKLLRADLMVPLTTSVQRTDIAVQALVYRPSSKVVDTLPSVHGVTDTVVAIELADHLSAMLHRMHEQKRDSARGTAGVPAVPARAPDSIPQALWDSLTAPANLMVDMPRLPRGAWVKNLMLITFNPTATQADRQAVIGLINGQVIGGNVPPAGERQYIVRLPYAAPGDSTEGPVLRAFLALREHPAVQTAYPVGMFKPNVLH